MSDTESTESLWLKLGVFALVIWLVGGLGAPWAIVALGLSSERLGQAGDMFGAINALFSSFALLGLLAAILLQRKDLTKQAQQISLQLEEIRLQREEMRESREALEAQAEAQRAWVDAQLESNAVALLQSQISVQTAILNAWAGHARGPITGSLGTTTIAEVSSELIRLGQVAKDMSDS